MRNVKSDVAFFIGNDAMDNNVEDLGNEKERKNNKTSNSNGTSGNYHSNIINFSPTKILKDKKNKKNNRFGSINNFDLEHSESAQAMSLLHPDASTQASNHTIDESCSSSKKSRHSGKEKAKYNKFNRNLIN